MSDLLRAVGAMGPVARFFYKHRRHIQMRLSGVAMDDFAFAPRGWRTDPDGSGAIMDFAVTNQTRKRLKLLDVTVVLSRLDASREAAIGGGGAPQHARTLGQSLYLAPSGSVEMRATFPEKPARGCVVAIYTWSARRWWWPVAWGDAPLLYRDWLVVLHDDRVRKP